MDKKVPTVLLLDEDLKVIAFGDLAEPQFQKLVDKGVP